MFPGPSLAQLDFGTNMQAGAFATGMWTSLICLCGVLPGSCTFFKKATHQPLAPL